MPEFANPFSGNTPGRKMTDPELLRAIRLSMAAELEASNIYEAQAEATDNELAKKVLIDISNEEREHAGEFMRLIELLAPDEPVYWEHGREEVSEMAEGMPSPRLDLRSLGGEHAQPGLPHPEEEDEDEEGGGPSPSIGNLRS